MADRINSEDRRRFLQQCGAATAIAALPSGLAFAEDSPLNLRKTYRAAAIGSTGHGDFGHGWDRVFVDLPGVEFVAIADEDPQGLQKVGDAVGVDRRYGDFREMLRTEDLDVVSVGMRHVDRHEDVITACAEAGVHVIAEKPLAPDLATADRIVKACDRHGVKLAMALPNRVSLVMNRALAMIREGRLGKVLSLRGRGKNDRRGGGEDLIVLGYHILDLMCLFAGPPRWTFAQVLEGERDVTASDGRAATEPVGPVAGDCVTATFGFADQVHGHFSSHRGLPGGAAWFGIEVHGTKSILAARSLGDVVWLDSPVINPTRKREWRKITIPEWDAIGHKNDWCNRQLVLDLLRAIEEDRQPIASGHDARRVQEMIESVYVSHLARARVELPLKVGEHPLSQVS